MPPAGGLTFSPGHLTLTRQWLSLNFGGRELIPFFLEKVAVSINCPKAVAAAAATVDSRTAAVAILAWMAAGVSAAVGVSAEVAGVIGIGTAKACVLTPVHT